MESLRRKVAEEVALFQTMSAQPTQNIKVVWVFSGPGTYLTPLKEYEEPWMAWMDRDRIGRGIQLVHEVTALKLGKPVQTVTPLDIKRAGPLLLYNGIPIENAALRQVAKLPHFPIPHTKIRIEDGRDPEGDAFGIRNTRDQVISFPLYRIGLRAFDRLALVSHSTHLPRILRYLSRYPLYRKHYANKVLCFPVALGVDRLAIDTQREIDAVCRYLEMGHLAEDPYPLNLGLDNLL